MAHIRRTNTSPYRAFCLFSCFSIILCSFIYGLMVIRSQKLIELSVISEDKIIDRQDEWRYQNSITAEWHQWRTVYNKQNNAVKWRVNWLNTAPSSYLGVIVYLARKQELDTLQRSLIQLSRLLSNNPRPVVIFHEGDFEDNDTQQFLAQTIGSRTPLAFERVDFSKNSNQPPSVVSGYHKGYYDMCRFFTLMLPTHPLLSLFSFYWRLDTHSYIFGPETIEDPFEIMQKQQIQYAFIMVNEESAYCATELWPFFNDFLKRHDLKPSSAVRQTQTDSFGNYSMAIIFTNFAIANVSLFRDHSLIQAWLHAVDRSGGIYRYRWGDAPIHTLILTQILERNQMVRLRYFGYMHRREYVCANETDKDLCKKQVQPLVTDRKTKYVNYEDGCCPSPRNPLCHYYPEINL